MGLVGKQAILLQCSEWAGVLYLGVLNAKTVTGVMSKGKIVQVEERMESKKRIEERKELDLQQN